MNKNFKLNKPHRMTFLPTVSVLKLCLLNRNHMTSYQIYVNRKEREAQKISLQKLNEQMGNFCYLKEL